MHLHVLILSVLQEQILSHILNCIDLLIFLGLKLEIFDLNIYVLVLDEQVEHSLNLFS